MAKSYLRFWGVRGSYTAPFPTHMKVGGNTSCVEITVGEHTVVCDAGTGIIPLGNKLVAENRTKDILIILTHYHWDHICGLPFFIPALIQDWSINFFGPGESIKEVKQTLDSQMQAPYFPVGTEKWMAKINYIEPKETKISRGPIDITYYDVHHPGITYGYKIKAGSKSIIYISDNECQFLDKSIKQKMTEFNEEELALFEAINHEEYEYELQSIRGVDILIHDAQYTPKDYETKRGWGHSCYVDVINYAIDANVKALYLYHHDPYNDDDAIDEIYEASQKIIQQHGSSLKCFVAREGMEIELD